LGTSEKRAGGKERLKLLKHEKLWLFIAAVCVAAAVSVTAAFKTPVGAATVALAPMTASAAPSADAEQLIDINTATAQELDALPGVGEKLAAAIIEYREKNGAFRDVADIMNVPGIGAGKYGKMKDRLTVRGEAGAA